MALLLMSGIATSVVGTMLASMTDAGGVNQGTWERVQWVLGVAFVLEYAVRLWTSVEIKRYRDSSIPRLRYAISPMALLDVVNIVAMLIPPIVAHAALVRTGRVLHMLRVMTVLRFSRYSSAMRTLGIVFRARSAELGAFLFVVMVLLVLSAGMMYMVEGDVQPARFGSIPDALWWSVTTLTTIGYGDALPVTALGRFVGGFIAVVGIGLVAIPAGILASGFQEAYRLRQEAARLQVRGRRCLACGQRLPCTEDRPG